MSPFRHWTPPDPHPARVARWRASHAALEALQARSLDRIYHCCGAIPGCERCNEEERLRIDAAEMQAEALAELVRLRAACEFCGRVGVEVNQTSVCESCAIIGDDDAQDV